MLPLQSVGSAPSQRLRSLMLCGMAKNNNNGQNHACWVEGIGRGIVVEAGGVAHSCHVPRGAPFPFFFVRIKGGN